MHSDSQMHRFSPALSAVPQCLLNSVTWMFQRHHKRNMLKLNSCSVSPKYDLSLLWMSVNGASNSFRNASRKPGRGHFHLFYCALPIHHQVFMFASYISFILLSYSGYFNPHRDHTFSGFDSCWSTHIHFGLLPPLSTKQPKR